MKKNILLSLLIVIFFNVGQAKTQQSHVIERVKEKLKGFKATETIKKSTAVAGVRGAEEREEETLFWFGKDTVTKDELELFKSALDKAEKGDREMARQALQSFLNKYPKSVFSPDAYEILKTLNH